MNKPIPETKQIYDMVKKLAGHVGHHLKVELYEDNARHNFMDDFARITISTWANITT